MAGEKRKRGRPFGTKETDSKVKVDGLTVKEWRFVWGYAMHGDRARAFREAGYKVTSYNKDHSGAYALLSKPQIRDKVDELSRLLTRELKGREVDSKFLIEQYLELLESSLYAKPVLDAEGNPTGRYQRNDLTAITCLRDLGRHVGFFPPKETNVRGKFEHHSTSVSAKVNVGELLDRIPLEARKALLEGLRAQSPGAARVIESSNGVNGHESVRGEPPGAGPAGPPQEGREEEETGEV